MILGRQVKVCHSEEQNDEESQLKFSNKYFVVQGNVPASLKKTEPYFQGSV